MKKSRPFLAERIFVGILLSFLAPVIVHAATIDSLIDGAASVVMDLIPTLLTLAVLVFFWGLVKFISHAGDEKTIADGKQLMIWGMIAIFVMVSLWGIIGFFQQELGLDSATYLGTLPAQPDTIPST